MTALLFAIVCRWGSFTLSVPAAPPIVAVVRSASSRHGVPELLLLRIGWRESGLRAGSPHPFGVNHGPARGGLGEAETCARVLARLRRLTGSWRRAVHLYRWGSFRRPDATGYVRFVMGDQ